MTLNDLFSRTAPYNFVIDLTPAVAEDWLSHCNTHNRQLMDGHIDHLAAEMQAGRWRLTHQGIAFSTNRVLLDGQHRLWAVVMSGMTVSVRVFVNEPPEAMDVLDTGQKRRNDQILSLTAGVGHVSMLELATLRAMVAGLSPKQKRSAAIERELLIRHRDAVQFALEAFAGARKFRGVVTAATLAVVARAWYCCDRDLLQHFADVLRTGTPKGENDQPALLLFQFLITSREGKRSQPFERESYAKTERALSAFLSGEKINRLFATPKELFPLPDEGKAVNAAGSVVVL